MCVGVPRSAKLVQITRISMVCDTFIQLYYTVHGFVDPEITTGFCCWLESVNQ